MWKDVLKEIKIRGQQFNRKFNAGLTEEFLVIAKNKISEMKNTIDLDSYGELLKEINGLDFNGYVLYGYDYKTNNDMFPQRIYDIFEMNAIWHENEHQKGYFFIGESNLSWYVYDNISEIFYELDMPSGDIVEEFESLDSLLTAFLQAALV